nr:ribonuclease H-like domain-containing protein [Tanacetum cinerariifolium]
MLKQKILEFRISETEGFHKGYDRMQKILSQLNQLNVKPDTEEINLRFLRALPSSWSQVALTLKTKGRLEFLSFDDLYYKLKMLEVDVRGYSTFSPSQSTGPSHSAFVSATSTSKKMPYGDGLNHSSTTTYSVPSNSKTGSHRTGNVIEDVLQSFVADTKPKQQLTYEDLEQIEKLDLEEMELKWQMAMLSVRVHKFEQKARRKINFDKKESARFNKQKVKCFKCQQRGYFARECRAKGGNDKKRYSSFKIKEIGKKEEDSKALISVDTLVDWSNHDSKSDEVITAKEFGMIAGCDYADAIKACANNLYNLINGANSKEANTPGDAGEFALMGVTSETKLDNHLVQTEKWRTSSKNLYKLIDSSMFVRTKVGLGFTDCISQKELGWDDSAFSVFTTTSEDVKGRPTFHSDKSSDVKTSDFASSDSSGKSSEHNSTDSTSCASTSSVSTSVNVAEIESKVRTPVKDPIIVQDLPSFTCNSSNKNEHSSRTSCNKNGSFNKKAGHFRKYSSSVSKLCLHCGSGIHLIKDCDFYEKQMTNTTVGIGVGSAVRPQPVPTVPTGEPKATPVPTGKPKGTPVPTSEPKATPVPIGKPKGTPVPTGKPKVHPVPTGKPKFTPVPTGRLHRPFPVATDKGCSPSVPSDTECLVLSKDFKLPDDSMVVLKVPRKHNLYTINLNDLYPRVGMFPVSKA